MVAQSSMKLTGVGRLKYMYGTGRSLRREEETTEIFACVDREWNVTPEPELFI